MFHSRPTNIDPPASLPARCDRGRRTREVSAQLKVRLTRFPRTHARVRRTYATGRFLLRRPHDRDYAAFGLFPPSTGLFLDVGANAGMSAMSLRLYQRQARIFSVEPNPYHAPDLRWTARCVRRMEYGIFAAGDAPGRHDLFIPVYRGVPLTAEGALSRSAVEGSPSLKASLGSRMDSADFRIERIVVEVRRLDELGLKPAFVKLDVQGHELQALIGMTSALETHGPPVLVEGPSDALTAHMAALGYEPYAYDRDANRLVSPTGYETNVMFIRGAPPVSS
jgi:FkbM family methyltransferase